MTAVEILNYLQQVIHTTVAATTDRYGLPVTCAVDMMDADESGLYFLTAKGKGFYNRLKESGYMALTGMKGEDTMSCVAVSVSGKVKELGGALLPRLFEKIRICTKSILPWNPKRLLRCSSFMREAESGLTCQKNR